MWWPINILLYKIHSDEIKYNLFFPLTWKPYSFSQLYITTAVNKSHEPILCRNIRRFRNPYTFRKRKPAVNVKTCMRWRLVDCNILFNPTVLLRASGQDVCYQQCDWYVSPVASCQKLVNARCVAMCNLSCVGRVFVFGSDFTKLLLFDGSTMNPVCMPVF